MLVLMVVANHLRIPDTFTHNADLCQIKIRSPYEWFPAFDIQE